MDEPDIPDGPLIASRACESCGHVKKLTPNNFPRVKGHVHKFQHICKSCFKDERNKRRMERMERRSVEKFISTTRNGGSNIPHTSEMLESIMSLFGGVNGFANTLAMQYYAAPPGGRIRTSILEMITRLAIKTAEGGGSAKPASLMTDEEIEAQITARLENVVSTHKNLSYIKEHQDVSGIPGAISLPQLSEADIAAAESMAALVRGGT
jgi:hypothetical protein